MKLSFEHENTKGLRDQPSLKKRIDHTNSAFDHDEPIEALPLPAKEILGASATVDLDVSNGDNTVQNNQLAPNGHVDLPEKEHQYTIDVYQSVDESETVHAVEEIQIQSIYLPGENEIKPDQAISNEGNISSGSDNDLVSVGKRGYKKFKNPSDEKLFPISAAKETFS